MNIIEMSRSDCVDLLSSERLGRLACCRDGRPYVVPVSFTLDGNYLYSFSLAGRKIEWMRANPAVCVQVDSLRQHDDWRSVVVDGRFEELPDRIGWKQARDRAWTLLSRHANWWEPGGMRPASQAQTPHLFYRIVIDSMSGRRAVPD